MLKATPFLMLTITMMPIMPCLVACLQAISTGALIAPSANDAVPTLHHKTNSRQHQQQQQRFVALRAFRGNNNNDNNNNDVDRSARNDNNNLLDSMNNLFHHALDNLPSIITTTLPETLLDDNNNMSNMMSSSMAIPDMMSNLTSSIPHMNMKSLSLSSLPRLLPNMMVMPDLLSNMIPDMILQASSSLASSSSNNSNNIHEQQPPSSLRDHERYREVQDFDAGLAKDIEEALAMANDLAASRGLGDMKITLTTTKAEESSNSEAENNSGISGGNSMSAPGSRKGNGMMNISSPDTKKGSESDVRRNKSVREESESSFFEEINGGNAKMPGNGNNDKEVVMIRSNSVREAESSSSFFREINAVNSRGKRNERKKKQGNDVGAGGARSSLFRDNNSAARVLQDIDNLKRTGTENNNIMSPEGTTSASATTKRPSSFQDNILQEQKRHRTNLEQGGGNNHIRGSEVLEKTPSMFQQTNNAAADKKKRALEELKAGPVIIRSSANDGLKSIIGGGGGGGEQSMFRQRNSAASREKHRATGGSGQPIIIRSNEGLKSSSGEQSMFQQTNLAALADLANERRSNTSAMNRERTQNDGSTVANAQYANAADVKQHHKQTVDIGRSKSAFNPNYNVGPARDGLISNKKLGRDESFDDGKTGRYEVNNAGSVKFDNTNRQGPMINSHLNEENSMKSMEEVRESERYVNAATATAKAAWDKASQFYSENVVSSTPAPRVNNFADGENQHFSDTSRTRPPRDGGTYIDQSRKVFSDTNNSRAQLPLSDYDPIHQDEMQNSHFTGQPFDTRMSSTNHDSNRKQYDDSAEEDYIRGYHHRDHAPAQSRNDNNIEDYDDNKHDLGQSIYELQEHNDRAYRSTSVDQSMRARMREEKKAEETYQEAYSRYEQQQFNDGSSYDSIDDDANDALHNQSMRARMREEKKAQAAYQEAYSRYEQQQFNDGSSYDSIDGNANDALQNARQSRKIFITDSALELAQSLSLDVYQVFRYIKERTVNFDDDAGNDVMVNENDVRDYLDTRYEKLFTKLSIDNKKAQMRAPRPPARPSSTADIRSEYSTDNKNAQRRAPRPPSMPSSTADIRSEYRVAYGDSSRNSDNIYGVHKPRKEPDFIAEDWEEFHDHHEENEDAYGWRKSQFRQHAPKMQTGTHRHLPQARAPPPQQYEQKERFDPYHDNNGPTPNTGLNDGHFEQRSYESQRGGNEAHNGSTVRQHQSIHRQRSLPDDLMVGHHGPSPPSLPPIATVPLSQLISNPRDEKNERMKKPITSQSFDLAQFEQTSQAKSWQPGQDQQQLQSQNAVNHGPSYYSRSPSDEHQKDANDPSHRLAFQEMSQSNFREPYQASTKKKQVIPKSEPASQQAASEGDYSTTAAKRQTLAMEDVHIFERDGISSAINIPKEPFQP